MPNYRLIKGSVQHKFNLSRAKIQIFGGAFANGKSTALIVKACQLAKDYPGSLGLMGRETYPKLNDTLRRDFIKWCPSGWVKKYPTQDDNSIHLKNGSVIHFRYIAQRGKTREDGTTTSNLLSATYDWIAVDQVEDPGISYKDFLDLLGRLRGQTPYRPDGPEDTSMPVSGPRWMMLGANPARNWFYTEIVQPYILWRDKGMYTEKLIVDEQTGNPLMELYESDTYANKSNLEADYIAGLEAAYKGQMRDRYLLGKWAAFEGLVYPTFDPVIHMMKRDQMLEHLDNCLSRHVKPFVVEGYDFGIVSPTCYLLGFVDDWGRVFIIDGFHEPEFDYTEHPPEIYRIRSEYAGLLHVKDPIRADPAIFRRTVVASQQTGTTVARLLKGYGLKLVPADNTIVSGIAKVNGYLSSRLGIPHPITGEAPAPLIYFAEELDFIAREFGSYYWKRNAQQNFIDEPNDHDDHSPDTVKYILSFLPEPSKIVVPRNKLPPQWRFWHEVSDDGIVGRVQ